MHTQNKVKQGPQPLAKVHGREASTEEAKQMEEAVDRLLIEMVRQVRASGRQTDEHHQK